MNCFHRYFECVRSNDSIPLTKYVFNAPETLTKRAICLFWQTLFTYANMYLNAINNISPSNRNNIKARIPCKEIEVIAQLNSMA